MLVAELFRRYADEGASIAELTRWLTEQGVPTRTGKPRWNRSVVWAMLRNPAYAGRAVFGKTMVVPESPASTAPPGSRDDPRRGRQKPLTGHPRSGPRSLCPPSSPRTPSPESPESSESPSAWPTTSASPPATAKCPHCCKAWPPAQAAGMATTGPRPAPPQEDLLLPVPGLRRRPLRRRTGLRQQAGSRRLPRHRGLGPHHRPTRRPPAHPHRDR